VLLVFALALARPAAGAAAPPVAVIRYTAPAECPDAARFLSLVASHTGGAWDVRAGGDEADLLVQIGAGAAGKVGSVRRRSAADEGTREIVAADCRDLAQALALSAALSLGRRPPPPAAVPATLGAVAATPATPAEQASWMVGAGLLTTFLFPSQPMPEGSLFIERGRRPGRPGPALHAPDVRLAVSHARNDLFGGPERARFTLSSAGLSLCPAGAGLGQTAALRLCAAAEAGVLSGAGVAIAVPRTDRFLLAAAGASIGLRWAPTRRVTLEAQAGVSAPLWRTTFVFEMPRVEVARLPALVASGGITAGVTIP